MEDFSVEALVGNIVQSFTHVVLPDHRDLRTKIESHEFVLLKKQLTPNPEDTAHPEHWAKVLFTTADCAICEEVEKTLGERRFQVRKIDLSEWDSYFVEWIDNNSLCSDIWRRGATMYYR